MDMIDTWLFSAICLAFISLVAVLRIIPGPTRYDRLSAMNAAITLMTGAAFVLSVAWGDIFILEVSIIIAVFCYAVTIAIARSPGCEMI
jgi:multisubunit Na+/H+ antiporter MnhF subunit